MRGGIHYDTNNVDTELRMTELEKQLAQIFMPHAMSEFDRMRRSSGRFAHYTSAETGLNILRSRRVFLRNSTLMNDFSEVHHGLHCLRSAYNGPLGERLKAALRAVQPGLP